MEDMEICGGLKLVSIKSTHAGNTDMMEDK